MDQIGAASAHRILVQWILLCRAICSVASCMPLDVLPFPPRGARGRVGYRQAGQPPRELLPGPATQMYWRPREKKKSYKLFFRVSEQFIDLYFRLYLYQNTKIPKSQNTKNPRGGLKYQNTKIPKCQIEFWYFGINTKIPKYQNKGNPKQTTLNKQP